MLVDPSASANSGFEPQSIWRHLEQAARDDSGNARAFRRRSRRRRVILSTPCSASDAVGAVGGVGCLLLSQVAPTANGVIRVTYSGSVLAVSSVWRAGVSGSRIDHDSSHERRLVLRIVGGVLVPTWGGESGFARPWSVRRCWSPSMILSQAEIGSTVWAARLTCL